MSKTLRRNGISINWKPTIQIKNNCMKSVKGTQTELNLMKSFAGESQARMRYTFFAKEAKKEGKEITSTLQSLSLLECQLKSRISSS